MNGERIELRYYSPKGGGYVTESFTDTNTQTAINSIKSRAGNDVTINAVKIIPAPTPPHWSGERGR
ncbi:MAG: hypothetical protein WCS70_11770 [Verrucomicrobiota bacterium]